MAKIVLKTRDCCGGGKNLRAKPGVSVEDVCEIAENEVYSGFAVWAGVYISTAICIWKLRGNNHSGLSKKDKREAHEEV